MITNQIYIFFIFIANGVAIGLLFDFFRILRRSFHTKDIITYIEDILFWILTGFVLLYSIFTFSNGEIRLFMFLGVIIGTILYMLLFSSYIIKANVVIINFIKKILLKTIKILGKPFFSIIKLIKRFFLKPVSFIIINIRKFATSNSKKIYNNAKNIVKKINNTKKVIKN